MESIENLTETYQRLLGEENACRLEMNRIANKRDELLVRIREVERCIAVSIKNARPLEEEKNVMG
jgi:hypothetical protein